MVQTGKFSMTIGGEAWTGERHFEIVNPATGEVFASAPDCTADELTSAVHAARVAFPAWSARPLAERQALVEEIAKVLAENSAELARLLTLEQGKPLGDAGVEIFLSGLWAQGAATLSPPHVIHENNDERYVETRYEPVGVVGAITPWNFPINLAIWKIAPALVSGCTIVLKPSPLTPLATLRLGELLRNTLPPGVLNVVSGGDALGPMLTAHAGIDKISFTGSTETGRKIMRASADTLKRIVLELGGNDPAVVMPDVDVEETAAAVFWAAFRNNGQVCVASKRVYVHSEIYDRFAQALVDYAGKVKIGDGLIQGTEIGPIQNAQQFARVQALIEDSRQAGYKFLCGGEPLGQSGYFMPITIIDNPPDDSRVVTEEAFGPLLPLLRFDDVDDLVRRLNDTPYGLAASIWTKDMPMAQAIGGQLEVGTVWINESMMMSPIVPFAGRKASGLGIENGVEGLTEYMVPKTYSINRGPIRALTLDAVG